MPWIRDPDSGGVKISAAVKARTEQRIRQFAEAHYAGKYTRLDIRFRAQFCYIDAYTEPAPPGPGFPPEGWHETRDTPIHLCRLRYFDKEDEWGFAFYAYSGDKYELSVFPNGEFFGTPEDAFAASAMYLE